MSVTVKANGLSVSHRASSGVTTATMPDVCKTPPGPVPIPYPNVSLSSDLAGGSSTVTADGGNMISLKGSEFSKSTGDEAGVAGGVKSGTNMKEAKWLSYSFDVKVEGRNVCRLTDKMTCNHGNTVCLSGTVQPNPMNQPPTDPVCAALYAAIQAAIWTVRTVSGQGLQGLAKRWAEAAENRGGWTATQNATHAEAYDQQAKGVKRKVDQWDKRKCDEKGGGGGLPQLAREYVTQRPTLGSGLLTPVLPTASAMTATTVATATTATATAATSTVTAANAAAVAGGAVATVGVGYLIYRGIRLLPSLFPPLWWTIPENLAIP
jgi:hypothetical protein